MWTIEKEIKKGEYLYARVKGHPKATKNNYVLYHRIVMENFLGRLLSDKEIVHHIDENKHNNDILNLELMHKGEHARHHTKTGRTYINCICPNCNLPFKREKRNAKVANPRCSRKCNGEYSRKIQLDTSKTH